MSSVDSDIQRCGSSEYETDNEDLDETYYPPRNATQNTNRSNITLRPRHEECKQNKNSFLCLFTNYNNPQTVEETFSSQQAAEWKRVMNEEYESLIKNKTYLFLLVRKISLASGCKRQRQTNKAILFATKPDWS